MRALLSAIVIPLFLVGPVSAQYGVPDKMGGTGYAKQAGKSCSAYADVCVRNNAGKADKCQSAREKCMQTGTFVGPQGKSFSGLAKQ